MGCGPSAPLEDELETNVLRRRSSSEDDDYAASSPRSRERDVRHWKRVDVECRGASRPPPRGRAARIDIDPNLKPRRRVTFAEELDEVVIPPLSEISRALRLDVYWSGAEFDLMHRQRQRLSVEVARRAYVAGRNGGDAADLSPSANFAGESLRGLGLVDERHLGSIAQRQRRIRDRGRAVVAAQHDETFSDARLADLAECLSRDDLAAAADLAAQDRAQVAEIAAAEAASPYASPTGSHGAPFPSPNGKKEPPGAPTPPRGKKPAGIELDLSSPLREVTPPETPQGQTPTPQGLAPPLPLKSPASGGRAAIVFADARWRVERTSPAVRRRENGRRRSLSVRRREHGRQRPQSAPQKSSKTVRRQKKRSKTVFFSPTPQKWSKTVTASPDDAAARSPTNGIRPQARRAALVRRQLARGPADAAGDGSAGAVAGDGQLRGPGRGPEPAAAHDPRRHAEQHWKELVVV